MRGVFFSDDIQSAPQPFGLNDPAQNSGKIILADLPYIEPIHLATVVYSYFFASSRKRPDAGNFA